MGMYSGPSAPDPEDTAKAQFNYEIGASGASGIINNPNTYDPYGQTEYSLSGYETVYLPNGKTVQVPRYNKTSTLTPEGQRLLGQQQKLGNKAFQQASGLLSGSSTAGANPWATGYRTYMPQQGFSSDTGSQSFMTPAIRSNLNLDQSAGTKSYTGLNPLSRDVQTGYAKGRDFNDSRVRVENAMMGRANKLLGESRDSEVARLAAMGLTPGGEAYSRVADQFGQQANDLAMQAVLAGGQEQSRLLGEDRMRADFGNQATAQKFAQRMGLISAENQRRFGETALGNEAMQGEFAMRTALRDMENARKLGDMNAYNAALEQFNNVQLARTQLGRDAANFQNQVRSAQVGEREAMRDSAINRLIGILSGAQVQNTQIPGYSTQGVAAPDYSGLVQSNYAQQVAAHNAKLQGISNIIGGGLGFAQGKGWI